MRNTTQYILKRLLYMIPMVLVITFLIYGGLELTPGDAISHMIPPDQLANVNPEQLEALRESYGLNDPFLLRYVRWLGELLHGNFGYSIASGVPIKDILLQLFPATLELSLAALAISSVLGSIPSFRTPFVLMPQSLGESRQLPAMLRDQGYSTAFFCGSEYGSMGFGAYARSAGVERLVSREDYEAKYGKGDFDGYWGIWDEPFLQFTGEELSQMPEPFFATLFTLSSHHPFVVPAQYEDKLPDGYTKIHKGVAYDDNAFRLFFERFGSEEWFRRTLFVFVADHVSSEKFAAQTRSYPGNYHIIGFMYTPDGALRGEVSEVVQQLDIMPTLLGLLGNREPYFAFGRDVLNEPQRPQWSVSWDGAFQAVTNDGTIRFDDAQETPAASSAGDSLLQDFRALVQQYYSHAEKKSYIVHD